MWMWVALRALNMSSWLQALSGHDKANGRAHGKRLRRELICIAPRVTPPRAPNRGPRLMGGPSWRLRRYVASTRRAARHRKHVARTGSNRSRSRVDDPAPGTSNDKNSHPWSSAPSNRTTAVADDSRPERSALALQIRTYRGLLADVGLRC